MSNNIKIIVSNQSTGFLKMLPSNRVKIVLQDKIIKILLGFAASVSIFIVFFQIFFLLREAIPALHFLTWSDLSLSKPWDPTAITPSYGIMPLLLGSILVTFGSMVIAIPIGIGSAIYISEIAPPKIKNRLKSLIELLSGIPSIIYGLFGMTLLTDWIRIGFNQPSGQSWLAGSLILAIMALPTIISIAEDGISMIPIEYREGSIGLGATKWQTILKVILPSAKSPITTAIILGTGRAIGETMAVMMVTGNSPLIPSPLSNIFSPIRTITATLGIEIPEIAMGSEHYNVLFVLVIILFGIIITLNMSAQYFLNRWNRVLTNKSEINHNGLSELINLNTKIKNDVKFNSKKILNLGLIISLYLLTASWFSYFWALIIIFGFAFALFVYQRVSNEIQQKIAFGIMMLAIGFVLCCLFLILGYIIFNGLPSINLEFLLLSPTRLGRDGGIFPAIVGTLELVFGSILIAVPLGIGAGIYLAEYSNKSKFTRIVRIAIDNLNGTPSIVFGLFGFAVFVLLFGWGKTLLGGQITLGLMILPTIIRTTEQSIKSVPQSLREGSYALGASKWQTICKIVLPSASPGIITGIILGMGRAAGETAPIMFTAAVFTSRFLADSLLDPVMALPFHIYVLATSVPGGYPNAFGSALVLLFIVLMFYSIAMKIRTRMKNSIKSSFFY